MHYARETTDDIEWCTYVIFLFDLRIKYKTKAERREVEEK